MAFFRQECWSGLPFPPTGDLPGPGIEPMSPVSSALQADSLPLSQQGSPQKCVKENEKQKRVIYMPVEAESLSWVLIVTPSLIA